MSYSSLAPCENGLSLFYGIPYLIYPNTTNDPPSSITGIQDNTIHFWVHIGLVITGFLIAVTNFAVQLCRPAPYGKHAEGNGRCPVYVRFINFFSNFVPGFVIFTTTYFLSGQNYLGIVNLVLYSLFTIHYLCRGIVSPLAFRYSHSKVTVWIPITTTILNLVYHFTIADFSGSAFYCSGYYYDPRFIVGVLLFVIGFLINWTADIQLIRLRKSRRDKDYLLPEGPLFSLISCPNYFGEGLEWMGWAIASWSLPGLVWWLYVESTLIPRARHNHKWYRQQFINYPHRRKAIIPFIY